MIQEYINYLGLHGKDKITGIEGVIESVSFDLYGCVIVHMRASRANNDDKDANAAVEPSKAYWMDISRVMLMPAFERVMPLPDFQPRVAGQPQTYDKGPAGGYRNSTRA